jgi:hypothetical protein
MMVWFAIILREHDPIDQGDLYQNCRLSHPVPAKKPPLPCRVGRASVNLTP